ncbi:MAG: TraM recognition domain-containing protein [Actinomycetales bacterium]|nr:TraM recognition domain-containing protein [Actinomycetales bacterium]
MRRNSIRSAAFTAVRMAHRWPWRPGAAGLGLVSAGWGLTELGVDQAVYAIPGGLTLTVGVSGWWWLRHVARPHSTKALVARRTYLAERSGGVATRLDVIEHAGVSVLRRKAPVLRPSLAGLSWWQRRRLDPRAVGVEVARLGWGLAGESVWSSCEDVTMRVAGPRSGKTTALICHGLDAPGALLTTSTRLDLAQGVHATRAEHGRVFVFDPAGIVDPAKVTLVRWRLLAGCEDFTTAQRRANALIPPNIDRSSDGERWDLRARLLLGLLLHAAAVSGRGMNAVRRWAPGGAEAFEEVRDALRAIPKGGAERLDEWREYCATNDKTRTSISNTMGAAVAWVSDDTARAIGDPRPDDPALIDLRAFITRGETLHLVGDGDADTGSRYAPLVSALTAEVAHVARRLAVEQGGRLDPPLTMILDEAGIATRLPLDRWSADMGGRGITLHISVQSFAQLRQTWGVDGSEALRGNVGTLLVYGGSTSAADLRDIASLIGEHLAQLDADDKRYIPVLTPAEIRAMGEWDAVILRRGMRVFVGHTPHVLERRRAPKPVTLTRPLGTHRPDRITTGELEALFTTNPDSADGAAGIDRNGGRPVDERNRDAGRDDGRPGDGGRSRDARRGDGGRGRGVDGGGR